VLHADLTAFSFQSKRSVGGHYGTWVLTCEEMTEPPKRLKAAVAAKGLPADEFGVCDIGETIRVIV
jgi:N-acyl-phosphatidylethanolamine-hydrolysing phospholipase D